jgi:hypothetical protein
LNALRFGSQIGQFTKDSLSIGESVVETLDTVQNTTSSKIAKSLAKAAGKGILDSLKNKEESEAETPKSESNSTTT